MIVDGPTLEAYRDFARYAAGDSRTLEAWATGVAGDPEVLAWLEQLPVPKRQPNLVFAAARWHGVPAPGPYAALREALLSDEGSIRETIMVRATQTNEVGRLATLVPAFAQVAAGHDGAPLALLEVGASAGLCLYPDRWSYAWETSWGPVLGGAGVGPLHCLVGGAAPLPRDAPRVAWRGGIDLNPLEVTDDDAMRWLSTLVWPEQHDRRRHLEQAVEVARAEPPDLVRGDLLELLPRLVRDAAEQGPVVVFHSAVVAYLLEEERVRFQELMTALVADGACHWISNEGKHVLPDVTATGPAVP
ncbi:MAG: DUF2332 domain-containing protein, partial [Nocardioides sp.]|nr:DUF2332 domain-containing protein [Nocardioides sp.]